MIDPTSFSEAGEIMARRRLSILLVVQGILGFAIALAAPATVLGGERAGEPEHWNKTAAREYLDRRGEEWFKFGGAYRGQGATKTSCVSCHSLLSYALARPVLRRISDEKKPNEMEAKVLEQVKTRVSNWDQLDSEPYQLMYDFDHAKKTQSRGTEAVLNALVLSLEDRSAGRKEPSAITEKAISILWTTQVKEGPNKGSWEWLNFGLEPWESAGGQFMGATLAAVAIGTARESGYSPNDADAKERLSALGDYLKKNYAAQNLHNRAFMLWASAKIDGLLTREQKEKVIAQLLEKQLPDGGFSLGSLGSFARKDVKDNIKTSDGYATGLVLHVLKVAGVPKEEGKVQKGLSWLRTNQDKTGAWRTASVNKNRAPESSDPGKANIGKFMWDAATAYAVMALED
jgi:squalene-hopene/tetraprenyl-beta-curcumene cyclase